MIWQEHRRLYNKKRVEKIRIPLYSRASDRSIADCNFRWHAEQQGLEGIAGASWFDIGHAMHTVYERGIKRQWKTAETYIKHAQEEVLNWVEDGEMRADLRNSEYLVSKHRPIDHASLMDLAEHLAFSFYHNVVADGPYWLSIYSPGWKLEQDLIVQPDTPDWEWKAGAKTTVDALYIDDGQFLIVDWKTGRSRRSDPRQLQFYRYLLELQGLKPFPIWGAFFHAEHGTWQIVEEYDPQEVEYLIGDSQVLKQVRPEATPSWLCDYCPARNVCPAFAPHEFEAHLRQSIVEHGMTRYEYVTDPS